MPQKQDHTGQRFGSITLEASVPGKPGYWTGRCDCGNPVEKRSDNLKKSGHPTCGKCPTSLHAITQGLQQRIMYLENQVQRFQQQLDTLQAQLAPASIAGCPPPDRTIPCTAEGHPILGHGNDVNTQREQPSDHPYYTLDHKTVPVSSLGNDTEQLGQHAPEQAMATVNLVPEIPDHPEPRIPNNGAPNHNAHSNGITRNGAPNHNAHSNGITRNGIYHAHPLPGSTPPQNAVPAIKATTSQADHRAMQVILEPWKPSADTDHTQEFPADRVSPDQADTTTIADTMTKAEPVKTYLIPESHHYHRYFYYEQREEGLCLSTTLRDGHTLVGYYESAGQIPAAIEDFLYEEDFTPTFIESVLKAIAACPTIPDRSR